MSKHWDKGEGGLLNRYVLEAGLQFVSKLLVERG